MMRGDWVVFEDHGKRKIGRVWNVGTSNVAVCYHFGCTTESTHKSLLRPYDREKDADLVPDMRIGHYRFENSCPDFDDAVCCECKPMTMKIKGVNS